MDHQEVTKVGRVAVPHMRPVRFEDQSAIQTQIHGRPGVEIKRRRCRFVFNSETALK